MSRRSLLVAVAAQLGLTPLFLWVWYGANSVSMKMAAVAVFVMLEIGIVAFGMVAELKKRSSTKS
jgi:hypothetical protein